MKKKMCKRKEYCPGKIPKQNRRFHCPQNTNSKCEIIAKDKDVVVKAWASFDECGKFQMSIYRKSKFCNVPVTLHIKASEYKKLVP